MRKSLFLLCVCGLWLTGCGASDGATGTVTPVQDTTAGDTTPVDATVTDTSGDTTTDAPKTDSTTPVCNPFKNTGCTEPKTQCGYDEAGKVACIPAGDIPVGGECGGGGLCEKGACVTSQSGTSQCSPYCGTAAHCPGSTCNKIEGGNWKVCDVAKYVSCDLFTQNCADKTLSCYDSSNGFVCLKTGSGEEGSQCQSSNGCIPGYTCAGADTFSMGLCQKICRVGGGEPSCDSIEASCVPIQGSGKYGFCDQLNQ
ncbi:MAG: hypothetical protein ACOYOB_03795 [Myxococcota bacterium]